MSRIRTLATLIALAAAAVACTNRGEIAPFGTPDPVVGTNEPDVPPDVDEWFRATEPGTPDRIIVGDRIRIQLQGRAEFNVERAVPADGTVPLYRAGDVESVQALGKTPVELEAEVAAAYADQFADPYVTVTVVTRAPRYVYVSGAVGSPQKLFLEGDSLTVSQAITMAGGGSKEADLSRVRITRYHPGHGKRVVSPALDIKAMIDLGDQADDLYVAPGDMITVPDASVYQVHVFGHVENPGAVTWRQGLTLSMAVTECGGFRQYARITKISIVRTGQPARIFDFEAVIDGEGEDLVLRPGDRVFVPESPL